VTIRNNYSARRVAEGGMIEPRNPASCPPPRTPPSIACHSADFLSRRLSGPPSSRPWPRPAATGRRPPPGHRHVDAVSV